MKDLLQLGNTARIDGIVNTVQLEMEEGATVNGTLKVGKEKINFYKKKFLKCRTPRKCSTFCIYRYIK